MNRERFTPKVRRCPECLLPWPQLTTHVCLVETKIPEPEHLSNFLFNALRACPVMLGGTDLSASIAAELAMPLAKVLSARSADLLTAMMEDESNE